MHTLVEFNLKLYMLHIPVIGSRDGQEEETLLWANKCSRSIITTHDTSLPVNVTERGSDGSQGWGLNRNGEKDFFWTTAPKPLVMARWERSATGRPGRFARGPFCLLGIGRISGRSFKVTSYQEWFMTGFAGTVNPLSRDSCELFFCMSYPRYWTYLGAIAKQVG